MIFEVKRKLFHSLAMILPIMYYSTSFYPTIAILMIANIVVLTIDINRHSNRKIQGLVDKFFLPIMKEHEKCSTGKLSGMSFMFLGFLLTALCFKKNIVILSWLILIICDSCASLVGKTYGAPTKYGKSLEGSLAFFLSAFALYLISQFFFDLHISFLRVVIAIVITSIAEFFSNKIGVDDNFLVPVVFCLAS